MKLLKFLGVEDIEDAAACVIFFGGAAIVLFGLIPVCLAFSYYLVK